MLTLVHVRLPPGFSARSANPPSAVHTAFHREGTLLLVAGQNEDHDMLWAVSSDSFPFQKQLMETQVWSQREDLGERKLKHGDCMNSLIALGKETEI